MSKWETENHFVSWLRLCPDNRISGEKLIGKGWLRTNNRTNIALKMAASTLRLSDTYLGAQFRRLRTKLGAPIAIKAMAAKLARLVYRMLRYGMKYLDRGAAVYEAEHQRLQLKHLKWKAAKLGYQIVQAPAAQKFGSFCGEKVLRRLEGAELFARLSSSRHVARLWCVFFRQIHLAEVTALSELRRD